MLFSYDVLRVTFQPWKFIALNLTWTITVGGSRCVTSCSPRHLGVAGALYGKLFGDVITATVGPRAAATPEAVFDRDLLRRMLGYGCRSCRSRSRTR